MAGLAACSDDGKSTSSGTGGDTGAGASSSSTSSNQGGSTGSFTGSGGNGNGGGSSGTGCLVTCADAGANCGPISNGCGDIVDCGTCTLPEFCGGGGPNKCGSMACVPKTCTDLGVTCGPAGDGCGALLDCGSCMLPQTCGGAGTPSVCGLDPNCTNLCLQQVTCPTMGVTTTIKGKAFAPNGIDPLPNLTVYVPNGQVMPFTPGVSCDQCADTVTGDPLVSATTDAAGNFTITNAPVGSNIPLVIQTGRWRRQITIPTVASCVDNVIPDGDARLPRNKMEGDIPLMAFATGAVDELECVLRKIGVQDGEFTNPNGGGRIHIYKGTGAAGARINANTPNENTLWSNQATLNQYDMVLFPCQGNEYKSRFNNTTGLANLVNYTSAGGRVFTTHYSYVWLDNNGPFDTVANWQPNGTPPTPDPQTGFIDMSFPKGAIMAQWLLNIGASTVLGQMAINTLRYDFTSVVAPTQLWVSINQPQVTPMHMTFNTPVGDPPDQQCGRVVFSDFHVEDAGNNANINFPTECPSSPTMSPQEKMLMFMLFDLGSCITPDIPTCTPISCMDQGLSCGPAGDGCGNVLDCGMCPPGQTCGGGGMPGVCGNGGCTPLDCAAQGIECGPAGDGCGGLIPSCGTCVSPQTCGGGGQSGKCGGGIPG